MKHIIISLSLLISATAFGQVIIGNETGTAIPANKAGILLEFAAAQNKGIILPYLRTLPVSPSPGTLAIDATTGSAAKVVYRDNSSWKDLSSGFTANLTTTLAGQPTTTSTTAQKSVIGATTSSADGVLVLESTNKTMVLPRVQSTMDVISPAPGMMVYVNSNDGKRLAVYNGAGWTYWKAD